MKPEEEVAKSPLPFGERARVRGTLLCRLTFESGKDNGQYPFRIFEDVGIPEAQNAITLSSKLGVATPVPYAFTMLAPINFDDQALLLAEKVNHPGTDWHLAAKLPPGEAPVPQVIPEVAFGVGQVSPQFACSMRTYLFHTPSPQPSPLRGEGEVRASLSDA